MQNPEIEIMAPVGCWESLAAALEAGATSVYFGIEHLNMRSRSSANFTTQDLHTIVERCHVLEIGDIYIRGGLSKHIDSPPLLFDYVAKQYPARASPVLPS